MNTTSGRVLVNNKVAVALAATVAITTMFESLAATSTSKPNTKKISQSISKNTSKKTIVAKKSSMSPAPIAADSLATSSASATRAAAPISASVVSPVTTGTTTAATPSAANSLLDKEKFRMNLNFYYYGAAVTEPLGGYQPDVESNYARSENSDPIAFDTHMVLGYKVHSNWTLSLNPTFRTTAGNSYAAEGSKAERPAFFTPIASFIRIQAGKFVKAGKFTWNGDFRVYPGITQDLHGTPVYLRTGQNLIYSLNDQWTLAAYNQVRYFYRTKATYVNNPGTTDFRFLTSPTLEFQALDNLNLALSYNLDVAHPHNEALGPSFWRPNGSTFSYVELATTWNVTKTVEVAPYVDIYTSRHIDPNSTQIGLNLAFTLL